MIKSFITSGVFAVALLVSPISSAADNNAGVKQASEVIQTVNINTADAEELEKMLKGVGKLKSQAIVDYRTSNGRFRVIEDLQGVKGIGAATVAKNRKIIKL